MEKTKGTQRQACIQGRACGTPEKAKGKWRQRLVRCIHKPRNAWGTEKLAKRLGTLFPRAFRGSLALLTDPDCWPPDSQRTHVVVLSYPVCWTLLQLSNETNILPLLVQITQLTECWNSTIHNLSYSTRNLKQRITRIFINIREASEKTIQVIQSSPISHVVS